MVVGSVVFALFVDDVLSVLCVLAVVAVLEVVTPSMTHTLLPLQEYPNGQHESPQVGSFPFSLVVLTGFLGWRVAFWS